MRDTDLSNNFKMIWKVLNRKEKGWFVKIAFMMFIGMLLEMLGVSLAVPAIAILMNPEQLNQYPSVHYIFSFLIDSKEIKQSFIALSGITILFLLYLLKTLYLTFLTWSQANFSYSAQSTVSKRIFSKYMRQDYSFHLQRNSAQLIQTVIGEVNLFTVAVQAKLILLTETLVLLGVSCLLVMIQPIGSIVISIIILSFSLLYYCGTKKNVLRWGNQRQVHEGYKIQHIQQGIGGIKDVKVTGREELFIERYNMHNVKAAAIGTRINTVQNIPRHWLDLLTITAVGALVFIYIRLGTSPEAILPNVALFMAAAFRIVPSGSRILNASQILSFSSAAISKVCNELSLNEPVEIIDDKKIIEFNNLIELRNISFGYPMKEPSIENLSLTIKKGEFIGIIGPSGSGKTTLVDLILGFLDPVEGLITVDGQDIKTRTRQWRQKLGYVPQEIFLTDSSIRENIAFGLPFDEINNKSLQRAAKMAQIEDFINELPDKFDATLGERGVRISGGQKQRIGIARALYSEPEILILDEATSSLDTETEMEVMNSILKLKRKKTLIVVAHRISTLKYCDRIIEISSKGGLVDYVPQSVLLE